MPPPTHLDNVPLHIVQRGHNREPCFFAEADYFTCLHWHGEALKETDCQLHAYVLVTNHVHLLPPRERGKRSQAAHVVGAAIDNIRLTLNQFVLNGSRHRCVLQA